MKDFDCLFLGNTTRDILMLVSEPPASDQRITATHMVTTEGGIAATSSIAFQSLGAKAGRVTVVGGDSNGEALQKSLLAQRFSYLRVYKIEKEKTSVSTIQVERDGKRCITRYGGCADALDFSDMEKEVFHHARFVHIGGVGDSLMLEAAKYCKNQTRAVVSVDGGNLSRALTDQILRYCDIFIPDDKTACKTLNMDPKTACEYYYQKGPGIVCVTMGPNGAIAYDGSSFIRQPAYEVEVVDTTGAGGNFHGAFLYALAQGWTLEKVLCFSCVFSSITCCGLGGREAIPSLEQVQSAMRTIE